MRWPGLILALWIASCTYAQSTFLFANDNVDRQLWQSRFDIHDQQEHSLLRSQDRSVFVSDSTASYLGHRWGSGGLSPVLSGRVEAQYADSLQWNSHLLAGIALDQDFGERLSLDLALYGGITDGLPTQGGRVASADTYPGLDRLDERSGRTGQLWDMAFSLRYQASDIFEFELGRSKQFWGDGYRSLMLSDHAAPFPFFKINTHVWHVSYTNLFAWQQGKFYLDGERPGFEDKFTSSHLLSWNISPRVDLQLFEAIVWQAEDSLSARGFDVYYLNPVIFYRPVEFATGSADNALLGFGLSYKVYPSYLIYGQWVLDEFLLDKFRAGDGWWGNKFGVQVGVKGFDAFGIEGLYAQAEFNAVRPFTYSHGSPVQNYAHADQALAHPLGANFYAADLLAIYSWDDWELREHLSYSVKGDDENGENLGGDIFRSYVGPFRDLGNYIGQGRRSDIVENSIYLSKILHRASDARLSIAYHLGLVGGDMSSLSNAVSLSFRTNFGDGFR